MSDDAVVTTGSVDCSEVQNSVSGIASVVYGISSGGIVAAGVSDIAAGTGETITVTVSDVSENSLFNLVVTDGWVSEYVDINFCAVVLLFLFKVRIRGNVFGYNKIIASGNFETLTNIICFNIEKYT